MINKEAFMVLCKDKGISTEKAEQMYKEAACGKSHNNPSPKKKPAKKKPAKKKDEKAEKMMKSAYDIGFQDALKVFSNLTKE